MTTEALQVTLPWPPSVNRYWRHNRGRTHISHEGRAYRESIILLLSNKPTFEVSVRLDVYLHPPDRRRRDIDNILKALLDSLEHSKVVANDNLIAVLHVERREVIREGKAVILLREM